MIAEAMTKVEDLVKANKTPVTQVWGPRENLMYVDEMGILQFKRAEVGPARSHKLFSLPSFSAYVAEWKLERLKPTPATPLASMAQSVWYNRKGVVFFPDDIRREDRATIELEASHQMAILDGIRGKQSMDLRAFWKWIRIDFDRCIRDADKLLKAIQGVKWQKQQAGGAEVGRGKSSLGTEIRSQIEGLAEVPERIYFTVPAFRQHVKVDVPIECALELNENDCTFEVIPLPGAVEAAWAEAEYSIYMSLVGGAGEGLLPKDFPVF